MNEEANGRSMPEKFGWHDSDAKGITITRDGETATLDEMNK